ncbi:MAG TPA: SIMPL domain-containing protein [Blastocatellia bacterium]
MRTLKTNPAYLPVIFAVVVAVCSAVAAQEKPESPPATISATGEATVTANPDRAQIDIGVITQADNAQTASTQNATRLDGVMTALRKALGPPADLKTISYNLTPIYRFPKEGGEPTVIAYRANNVLRVRTDNLAEVGKIIDLATGAGANTIQQLQFELKDPALVRTAALKEAATQAKLKAEAMAAALGVHIVRVLSASEAGGVVSPRVFQASAGLRAQAAAAPTQVESGTIEVHATVSLVVQIAQPK